MLHRVEHIATRWKQKNEKKYSLGTVIGCIGDTTTAGYECLKFHDHETLYCTLSASALQQLYRCAW